MRRVLPALLTAFLLVTAGCMAGPGTAGDTPTSTPTSEASPTVTPTQTTTTTPAATPTPTPIDGSAVPGVGPNGSLNTSALLDAHLSAIATAGGVTESTYTLDDGRKSDRRTTVSPDFDRVHVTGTRTANGSSVTTSQWVNATGFVALTKADNRTEYRGSRDRSERRYRRQVAEDRRVADFLDRGSFTVRNVTTEDGSPRVALVSTDFEGNDRYKNVSVRLVVAGDGVIESLSVDGGFGNGEEFAFRYETVELGVEAVTVPDWVTEAPPIVDARLDFEFHNCSATYLELVHEGSDALPAGSTVEVTINETTYGATLDRVAANESRYLFLAEDGLRASAESPSPGEFRDIGNEVELRVVTDEGLVLTNAGMAFSCSSAVEPGGSTGSDAGGSTESGSASGGSSS